MCSLLKEMSVFMFVYVTELSKRKQQFVGLNKLLKPDYIVMGFKYLSKYINKRRLLVINKRKRTDINERMRHVFVSVHLLHKQTFRQTVK